MPYHDHEPILIRHQVGLIVYCAFMTVTFRRHGGVHAWDLTLPESYNAIYVSGRGQPRSMLTSHCLASGSMRHP